MPSHAFYTAYQWDGGEVGGIIVKIVKEGGSDRLHCSSAYPSEAFVISGSVEHTLAPVSTTYGVVHRGSISCDGVTIRSSYFFSIPSSLSGAVIRSSEDAHVSLFVRYGFLGQMMFGKVEEVGRVVYIDGCTDTLLVPPPRSGDPCLNSLHFPAAVEQTFHTHPSVRLGSVLDGEGIACVRKSFTSEVEELPLRKGDTFMIAPHELHRFCTSDEHMIVVAYHPDSDWGPVDNNHPMLNRTYVNR